MIALGDGWERFSPDDWRLLRRMQCRFVHVSWSGRVRVVNRPCRRVRLHLGGHR